SKSKSRAGSCIAADYPFTEFVELFAGSCGANRFSGRAARDHDRLSRLLIQICPKRGKADFFWFSTFLSDQVKLQSKSRTMKKYGERFLSRLSGLFPLRSLVGLVCHESSSFS